MASPFIFLALFAKGVCVTVRRDMPCKEKGMSEVMPGLGWGILNCFYSLALRIPVPVKEAWPAWDGFTSFLLLTCLLLHVGKSFWVGEFTFLLSLV